MNKLQPCLLFRLLLLGYSNIEKNLVLANGPLLRKFVNNKDLSKRLLNLILFAQRKSDFLFCRIKIEVSNSAFRGSNKGKSRNKTTIKSHTFCSELEQKQRILCEIHGRKENMCIIWTSLELPPYFRERRSSTIVFTRWQERLVVLMVMEAAGGR